MGAGDAHYFSGPIQNLLVFRKSGVGGMPTILGVNFLRRGGRPEIMENKATKFCRKKFAGRTLGEICGQFSWNSLGQQKIQPKSVLQNLESTLLGARKSTQTFSGQSFSRTLRVMDVRAENRGRPHQKVHFPAAPLVGRNFLTPGHPGVKVRNVRGKSGPKSLCLCRFSRRRTNVQQLTCNIDLSCYFYYLSSLLFSLS